MNSNPDKISFDVYRVSNSRFVQSFKSRKLAVNFCRANRITPDDSFDWTDDYYIEEHRGKKL